MAATRPKSSGKAKSQNGDPQFTESEREEFVDLAKRLPGLDDEEKRALLSQLRPQHQRKLSEIELEQRERAARQGPKMPTNNDELWEFIKERTGFEIPRVAVCEDHQAPFDFMADAFFNRKRAILVLAGREGGKTLGVSIIHVCNAELKPGIESCTFGAILPQAKRAYKHVKSFIFTRDDEGRKIVRPEIEGDPTRMETHWKCGSMVELLVGSVSGVNSPHPQVVHADEIDLMDEEVWAESRNMSSSGTGTDGKRIPALDIATSTRKSMKGLMQKLLDEIAEAEREGHRSVWSVYAYCFVEVAEEQPHCRLADPVERVQRLIKLGRDARELCACHECIKGEWQEGVPRTFESVCRGRLFKSRGWMNYDDIVAKFLQNSKAVWEAQMECRRPIADGLYLPNFSRERHTLRGWVPRPEYGRIAEGVDWGGAAPSVVLFIQSVMNPVEITGYTGAPVIVKEGSYVIFDMIEMAGIGATKLADMTCEREMYYRQSFPGFRVRGRFADMAGRQQRDDWHEHSPPLRTHWYIARDFDPTVETLQDLVEDGLLYIDVSRCASLVDDFESWRRKGDREVKDASTHGPAAARYALGNLVVIDRKEERRRRGPSMLPVVKERGQADLTGALAAIAIDSSVPTGTSGVESEAWRKSFGMLGDESPGNNDWRV
jgi:hypothetical protein